LFLMLANYCLADSIPPNRFVRMANFLMESPFLIVPVAKIEPETGLSFGITSLYRFKPNKLDSSGSVSTIKTDVEYTTERQFTSGIKYQIFGANRDRVIR